MVVKLADMPLEVIFTDCLKDAWTTDAVDIADAAAQGAGDLAKVRPDSSVRQAECGVLVMLKASKRASRADSRKMGKLLKSDTLSEK